MSRENTCSAHPTVDARETGFMYRLAEMSDRSRLRVGGGLLALGTLVLAVAVIIVHFGALPEERFVDGAFVPVVVEPAFFNAIPRGIWVKAFGYLLAFVASQMMIVGAALLWVLNQKLTWARATFAAFLVWMEWVVVFGIVPSEWLNFAQTDLEWSPTRPFITVPSWLLLGNEVSLSYAALKDVISGTYHIVVLAAAPVFAWKLQGIYKDKPKAPPAEAARQSPYGRPLVRGAD